MPCKTNVVSLGTGLHTIYPDLGPRLVEVKPYCCSSGIIDFSGDVRFVYEIDYKMCYAIASLKHEPIPYRSRGANVGFI